MAGGGVHYAQAEDALLAFCERTGIPVGETQAGKGSLPHGHPQLLGAVGSTGTTAANVVAAEADVVIGIGTRWSDFTTASRTAFQGKDVRFVNLNVARFDAAKHAGLDVVGDARASLAALTEALDGYSVDDAYRERQAELWQAWEEQVEAAYHPSVEVTDALADGLLTQGEVLGAVNELADPRDVVLCAAGSMPGDLHKLWRVRDRKAYHVEYGYSCMGYEIPASIGIRLADETRDVFAMVGDGGYLMMPTELVTAVQERVKVIVVLVQNYGFHSIGSLSESLGSRRFGTRYRMRDERTAASTVTSSGSTSPPTPAAWAPTSSRCTRATSCSRRSNRPRPHRPTADRSSSTSRPTRSCSRPTVRPGGTCPSARSPSWTRPATPTGATSRTRPHNVPSSPRPSADCTRRNAS